MRKMTKIYVFIVSMVLTITGLSSCEKKHDPTTLLQDTMTEINERDSGYEDFKVYNNTGYFAIVYQLENSPENNAKLRWLSNHEDLEQKFRAEILKKLKKGNILARVVREKKLLVLAVGVGEMEYHTVFSPKEIIENVFKK